MMTDLTQSVDHYELILGKATREDAYVPKWTIVCEHSSDRLYIWDGSLWRDIVRGIQDDAKAVSPSHMVGHVVFVPGPPEGSASDSAQSYVSICEGESES